MWQQGKNKVLKQINMKENIKLETIKSDKVVQQGAVPPRGFKAP